MQGPSRIRSILVVAALLASPCGFDVQATEVFVTSMSALQSAINTASSGDTITLANGIYVNAALTIGTGNITVRAATPGGVFLNGTQNIDITGSSVRFIGFQFTSGNIGSDYLIQVSGNHNVLTQLNFNGYKSKKYIQVEAGSQHNEISYCNIERKDTTAVTIGCAIQISTSPAVPGYHRIRYCSFKNFPGPGGDFGNEPVRIGLGDERNNASRTIVEYCVFDNVGAGDSESISVKCCENVIRFCTFRNNPQGMLVFRNGDRNVAYGNFFLNGSGGIRCKEARDTYCYNNYFETSGATGATDAITLAFDNSNGYALNNINFIHNTFVNCGDIDLGGSGPTAVSFTNNIFKKNSGNIFTDPSGVILWAGNIYFGSLGIGITSGMRNADPRLALNSHGYYELTSLSPAIDTSSSSYPTIVDIANVDDDPSVLLDISGQLRPALRTLKDVGCDEFTQGSTTNHPLALSEVGPSYLGGPTSIDEDQGFSATPDRFGLSQNHPNPFNPSTRITYTIGETGLVSLKIYDVLGREVANLVNEIRQAGTHSITWDAADVCTGTYICKMQAASLTDAKKITLMK